MFIWDFVVGDVMGQIIDWAYAQIVGFLANFFSEMGGMGVEIFETVWIQSIVLFFFRLAWALYVTGLVVAVFEVAIEYQSGRGNIRDSALNAVKGFMAVSLFSVTPIRLFELSVELQGSLTAGLTGAGTTFAEAAQEALDSMGTVSDAGLTADVLNGLNPFTDPIMVVFIVIMMGYAVIKVFFASLKRGGILLIQIAVGSLYMFSVPRGYMDGFIQWCKQIVGLCLTSFLQVTVLTAGLLMLKDNALLGLGLMLSAGEIPRIAGNFGLDTSTNFNLMSNIYAAQTAVNMSKTVLNAVAP